VENYGEQGVGGGGSLSGGSPGGGVAGLFCDRNIPVSISESNILINTISYY
jgi:hypothetical protein